MRTKIKTLYEYAKAHNVSLLPVDTNFNFWEEYENNNSTYDRYILDTFRDFFYWVSFKDETTAEILEDFKSAVASFLTINSKRYSELYRLHILPDSAYDIVNNYKVVETHEATFEEGQRSDSESVTQGAQQNTDTTSLGAHADNSEKKISAFNSGTYQDGDETINSYGAQTNSNTSSIGSRSDSMSSTKGAQTNTEEYTTTKEGNIGVQTPADVIGGHLDLWDRFNFYKQIFDEIAKCYFVCDNRYR